MESFYDIGTSDLKDIWESDLDPSDPMMKLSTDSDMHDWFLERDIKMPQVILHDKLISDALLGNLPIKTEHSYSLNSDGDSMPDSPGSLQTKMDDMDDDCYPTISMTSPSLTSHTKHFIDTSSISTNHSLTQNNSSLISGTNNLRHHTSLTSNNSTGPSVSRQIQYNGKITMNTNNSTKQQTPTSTVTLVDTDSIGSSDIDIDDTCIKDEPMSPESSCPPSPSSNSYTSNLHMANMASFTNTDLVFEHKNGSLKLSPASHQSLLKSQQFILNETNAQNLQTTQRIIIPKCNIKIEPQSSVFGLPPTPPSSLPSDESEGNQSPEHHLISPMSPPTSSMPISSLSSSTSTTALTTVTSTPIASSSSTLSLSSSSTTSSSSLSLSSTATTTVSTRRNSSIHHNNNTPASHHTSTSTGRSGYSGSTRQPIHTPLISSQPKGSTGTLVLTEEEKRTLLAEGYPIPTRLPLTKAEEKSLKKIRRKIKNKISAQESRRKKKEYMDQLERKVEILVSENSDYRKRVETLEDSNANLLNQLAKLKAMLNKQNSKNI